MLGILGGTKWRGGFQRLGAEEGYYRSWDRPKNPLSIKNDFFT